MADVFVSYSRSDKARVAPLVAALEAQGWSVWWDPAIAPGQQFDRLIADELERARAVLVVWTADSVESRWVRGEAREGADRGILVPVQFGPARLPIDFRAFHTTDLDHAGDVAGSPPFQEVVRALEALVGRARPAGAGRVPLPAAPEPGAGTGPPRIAICVLPLRQPERRPGAAVLQRRHHRGHHHRALALAAARRAVALGLVQVSRARGRHGAGRARA